MSIAGALGNLCQLWISLQATRPHYAGVTVRLSHLWPINLPFKMTIRLKLIHDCVSSPTFQELFSCPHGESQHILFLVSYEKYFDIAFVWIVQVI